jgi:hypothetical protein
MRGKIKAKAVQPDQPTVDATSLNKPRRDERRENRAGSIRTLEGATKEATDRNQERTKNGARLTNGMIAKKHMTKINVSCPFPSSAKWRAHLHRVHPM